LVQTNPHPLSERDGAEAETTISFSHLVHTLRAYSGVIVLTMIGVAVAYAIVAIAAYIWSPSQKTTSLSFRLDFEGAAKRLYPNGLRFSPAEIVSAPVLEKVYNDNHIERFSSFSAFSRLIFVLESNPAYERLSAQYQARLADPKLGSVERERIENEFAMKRESLAKNEYSIDFLRSNDHPIPDTLVRKVLNDVLSTWAQFAINEQHALDYRVSVVGPQILDEQSADGSDYIARSQVLRSKVYRVIVNLSEMRSMPGSDLVRTSDHLSLNEIQFRLDEIVRFRLEPLVGLIRNSGPMANPALTIRFLENQLAYDQRLLQGRQSDADMVRQASAVYTEQHVEPLMPSSEGSKTPNAPRSGNGETVMPQLSDTFLDRLLSLAAQSTDTQFRQKLVSDYRDATAKIIPMQQAVAYDTQILNEVRNAAVAPQRTNAAEVQAQIQASVAEVRSLIIKMNEIYQIVSRNTNPAAQLYTVTDTPVTRIDRTMSLSNMVLYGVLLLLVALPVTILLCLLHNRVREEEAEEGYAEVRPQPGS
jgi:hypothetical protein